jgi:hypothetical protein
MNFRAARGGARVMFHLPRAAPLSIFQLTSPA